ncbi:redox-sensing transcriptional repressor Rex [Proteiniclasticum sp. QWL-01]|uniref:redox-sensing transcriptional repressor Rex n=1 Tax=Proteiniclasticum sp. QWL-01 TaxID=3036945 RepID=UPI0022088EE6|nr:redox-sensing transcriptional repressor Rex [Proteiniclasticum sp. QWL-01]UUM10988.1 redox-sensing transcriptional repressor Rex [Clostridiaceae bacterium HFYG-1003]WFF72317.1 redox-sensing transcriptional repressor Rex [Proteiniclasticum sp. QWL-01]
MDKKKRISMAVIKRMPRYYRHLAELLRNDVDRISSKELSEKIGFTASQIRQDFNNFGGFGQQGYGYNVRELFTETGKILGLDKSYKTVIVGAGNIGQAIANYTRFDKFGFDLKAIFDANPKLIGLQIRDVEILDIDLMDEFLTKNQIDIGIICVPTSVAQKAVDTLVRGGVKGVWNFAPIDIQVPKEIALESVHLSDSLLTLVYLMNDKVKEREKKEKKSK